MMKAMDSGLGQGAEGSDTGRYREHRQRPHRPEDALLCFEIPMSEY